MNAPIAPSAVFSSRLAAPPATVWARLNRSEFIADYLDAELPVALLNPGPPLRGRDSRGRAISLTVTESDAPCSLALMIDGAEGSSTLRCSISACDGGSRLTLLHEPAVARSASGDALVALLARPLPAPLLGAAVQDSHALAAAIDYLAGTAAAVRLLLAALATHEAYAKPAPDRFSLAEQLWHLADVEQFGWAKRLPRVLAETQPELPGVDGDRLAVERRYQQRPWRGAARRFIAQRRRALTALAQFDSATLQRPVLFGGERISAGALLAAMLAHDHEHRLEIAGLWRQQRGAAA
jgi:DinB family protein